VVQIEYLPSPNYWTYNSGFNQICLHGTSGPAPTGDSVGWLRSVAAGVSASFEISKTGRVTCLVNPWSGFSSWAQGIPESPDLSNPYLAQDMANGTNFNLKIISIEHDALSNEMISRLSMPPAQLQASLELSAQLCHDFSIPPIRSRIITHSQIMRYSRANCPGVINPDNYVTALANMMNNATSFGGGGGPVPVPPKLEIVVNGFTVRGEILLYCRKLFNQTLIVGMPLCEEFVGPGGLTTQIFERAVLQFHPEWMGTDWVVQGMLTGRDAPGAFAALTGGDSWQNALVSGPIKDYFYRLFNPVLVLGYPISLQYTGMDGRQAQRFERGILKVYEEFKNTDWYVQGDRLGSDYLKTSTPLLVAA
jgi:hypothetical protein